MGGIVAMVYAMRYPDYHSKLILSGTSTQPAPGERSFAVFDRLGGPRAPAAGIAFWTDPNEDSLLTTKQYACPFTLALCYRPVSMSER
jgi:pimeloyl-ACP methyl ester carboxylesterase